jgi:hypothetical protein
MESIALLPSNPRETLGGLGIPQQRVARMLGTTPRHLRRWRSGERRVPFGVAILVRLLAAGMITIDQVEAAARVDGGAPKFESAPGESDGGSIDPLSDDDGGDGALVESDSVASKVLALTPGACRWPEGNIDDPAGFRFCAAPAGVGHSYCPEHRARATLRLPLRRSVRIQLDAMAARVQKALQTPHGAIGCDSVSRLVSRGLAYIRGTWCGLCVTGARCASEFVARGGHAGRTGGYPMDIRCRIRIPGRP